MPSSLLVEARRFIGGLARESLKNDVAEGVAPSAIHVSEAGDGAAIIVRFEFGAWGPPSTKPLLLSAPNSDLVLEEINSSASLRPMASSSDSGIANAYLLNPPRNSGWEGTTLEMKLRVNQHAGFRNGSRCLVLPRDLPQLTTNLERAPQAEICLPGDGKYQSAGIAGKDRKTFLQAILVYGVTKRVTPVDSSSQVLIGGRAIQELSESQQQSATDLLSRVATFHGRTFGYSPDVRLLLGDQRDWGSGSGALFTLEGFQSLGINTSLEPEDVMIGSRLAGIWWGNGCRITGRFGAEIEAAIRAAAGMLWADAVDGVYRKNVYAEWERRAKRGRGRDWWDGHVFGFRHGLHARMTLALCRALRTHEAAKDELKSLTNNSWGWYVPTSDVLTAFKRVGVTIPRY